MKKAEEKRVREVLFREIGGSRCDIPWLSRRTGIPEVTLRRYKKEPDIIPFSRLLVIADNMGISVQDAGYLLTGRTK